MQADVYIRHVIGARKGAERPRITQRFSTKNIS